MTATPGVRERKPRRRWRVVVVVIVAVLIVGAGVSAVPAASAAGDLAGAVDELSSVNLADSSAILTRLESTRAAAVRLRDALSAPGWRVGASVPWIGAQIDASSALADSAARLSGALGELLAAFDASSRAGDSIMSAAAIRRVSPALDRLAAEASTSGDELDSVDQGALIPALAHPFTRVRSSLATARPAITRAAALLRAFDGLCDTSGSRMAVLAQNSAELRSSGGIVGAVVVLGCDGGRIAPAAYYSDGDLKGSVLTTADFAGLGFDVGAAGFAQNLTMPLDFRASGAAAQRLLARYGHHIDSVLAIDVPTLGTILQLTGPLTIPDGTVVDHNNVVAQLLSVVYARYNNIAEQNKVFALTVAALFSRGVTVAPSASAVHTLVSLFTQGHILLWSTDSATERAALQSGIGGWYASTAADRPRFAVLLQSARKAKIDFYVRASSSARAGTSSTVLTVRLHNGVTDPAKLTRFVTGEDALAPAGTQLEYVTFAVPVSASVTGVLVESATASSTMTSSGSWRTVTVPVTIAPGSTATASVTLAGHWAGAVTTTPTIGR